MKLGVWLFDSFSPLGAVIYLICIQMIQGYLPGHQAPRLRFDWTAVSGSTILASSFDRFKFAFFASTDNSQSIQCQPIDDNNVFQISNDGEESSMSRIVQAWKSKSFTAKEKAQISALLKNIIPHLSASDLSKVIQGLPWIKLPSRSKVRALLSTCLIMLLNLLLALLRTWL